MWKSANPDPINDLSLNVADDSQLAIAGPIEDGDTFHLFYQQEGSADNSPLREIVFKRDERSPSDTPQQLGNWVPGELLDNEAAVNTHIAAVSAAGSGDVRIYYEGKDGYLRVNLWNAERKAWTGCKPLPLT